MDEENKLVKDLNLIVKSSVLVLIASLTSKIFVYLYRVIIARYYGPEVFGLFSLAVMVSSLIIVDDKSNLNEILQSFGVITIQITYITCRSGILTTILIRKSSFK